MISLKIKLNGNTKNTKLIKTWSHIQRLSQEATSVISELISRRKDKYQNYIASRLNDPKTNAKTYCSILKTFYNGKKNTDHSSSPNQ